MEANELSQLLLESPLSAVPAAVMVVLTALTMRSVIKREQAMLPQRRPADVARESYADRWRTRT